MCIVQRNALKCLFRSTVLTATLVEYFAVPVTARQPMMKDKQMQQEWQKGPLGNVLSDAMGGSTWQALSGEFNGKGQQPNLRPLMTSSVQRAAHLRGKQLLKGRPGELPGGATAPCRRRPGAGALRRGSRWRQRRTTAPSPSARQAERGTEMCRRPPKRRRAPHEPRRETASPMPLNE